jgi:hypothetical protein
MGFLDKIPQAFVTDLILVPSTGEPANALATITINGTLAYIGTSETIPDGNVWKAEVIDGVLNVRLPLTYDSPASMFQLGQCGYTVVWSGDMTGTESWNLQGNIYQDGQHYTRTEVLFGQGAF